MHLFWSKVELWDCLTGHRCETGYISNQDIDAVVFEFSCQYLLLIKRKTIEKQYQS